MQKGAEAVHAANPNVLVILSGLSYAKDLSFLLQRPVNLTFAGKLVFEVHWYSFSDAYAWGTGNPNQVCAQIVGNLMRRAGFVVDQLGYPLFVSEFGVDQRGVSVNDNRYLDCFMGVAAEMDWEWALWTLAGSYYLREGGIGSDETYGILNWNWCEARNSSFLDRISAIQSPFRGKQNKQPKTTFNYTFCTLFECNLFLASTLEFRFIPNWSSTIFSFPILPADSFSPNFLNKNATGHWNSSRTDSWNNFSTLILEYSFLNLTFLSNGTWLFGWNNLTAVANSITLENF